MEKRVVWSHRDRAVRAEQGQSALLSPRHPAQTMLAQCPPPLFSVPPRVRIFDWPGVLPVPGFTVIITGVHVVLQKIPET